MSTPNQIDRLHHESVRLRVAGDHAGAVAAADAAIAACTDQAVPASLYVAAGLAHSMVGNLAVARSCFEASLNADPAQPITRYFLASVLACEGELFQAAEIFSQGIKVPISENESTSTRIIQLNPSSGIEAFSTPPFGRELTRFPEIQAGVRFELVLLVACDGRYLELFIEPLIKSLEKRTARKLAVHIHVVNPTSSQMKSLDRLGESNHCPIFVSSEKIVFPSLADTGRKTYFSCARFLIAPAIAEHYQCPILITDVDQMIVDDLDPLLDDASSGDIGLLKFQQNQSNLLSLFSASVLFVNSTTPALQFLQETSAYISKSMHDPEQLTWHLDQAAIASIYLQSPHIQYAYLNPSCMHSSLDGTDSLPDGTLFWSITYHVAQNAQKLGGRLFRSLLPETSVFDKRVLAEPPRVTIVMPVFNGGNYLREAIESALAQTWGNVEVLVIDDGSTDAGETEGVALSFGDRIRYLKKENGGVASALNLGIREMSGDVFCWLSHDDLYVPDKVEKQMRVWAAHDYSNVILYSDYRLIDENGETLSDVRMDHRLLKEKPVYALFRAAIHGCSIFIPSEIFEDVGVFDESLPTTQDYELWSRMIQTVPFIHIPEILVMSRWHDAQGSKQIDHREEAANFWSELLLLLPEEELILLEGSKRNFLKGMSDFLQQNGITAAAQRADALAESSPPEDLVSVVIPIYNRYEKALSAIDSVLSQSYENIELIVIDDGSTRNSELFLNAIKDPTKPIELITQENSGPGAARNTGLKAARGRYVAFLDSDDLFLPMKIEIQVAMMKRMSAAISHTSYWRLEEDTLALTKMPSGANMNGYVFPGIISHCPIATPTVMVDREMVGGDQLFAENGRIGEDVITWIRITSRHPILGIPDPLSVVRTTSESAAKNLVSQQQGLGYIISELEQDPILSKQTTEIETLRESLFSERANNI